MAAGPTVGVALLVGGAARLLLEGMQLLYSKIG